MNKEGLGMQYVGVWGVKQGEKQPQTEQKYNMILAIFPPPLVKN